VHPILHKIFLGFIPHGPTDKASAYGAEDSRFDPWCGSPHFPLGTTLRFFAAQASKRLWHGKKSLAKSFPILRFFGLPHKQLACGETKRLWHGKKSPAKSFPNEHRDRPVEAKCSTSTPGIEPGIFRSVGGRLIHWAMWNEAQEDFGGLDDFYLKIL